MDRYPADLKKCGSIKYHAFCHIFQVPCTVDLLRAQWILFVCLNCMALTKAW